MQKVNTMDNLVGKNGLIKRLTKHLTEHLLQEELTRHLGYEPYRKKEHHGLKSRNGSSTKQLKGEFGSIPIQIPRDRQGEFEPLLVARHQREFGDLEGKILSLYAKGLSVRDIREHLQDFYGLELSPAFISRLNEWALQQVKEWQNRPLESDYVIVYFDAIHYKIRHEGKVQTRAAYTCLGIDSQGKRDLLGIWIVESEGAHFWLSVITELQNRGVEDILIACVDGLKGFPESLTSIFPQTWVQLFVIHQICNSLRYVAYKDQREFMKNLRRVYQAPTRALAEEELLQIEKKWGKRYPIVIHTWKSKWEHLSTYFEYAPQMRKLIYTTNSVKALHRGFRKVTNAKTIFPTDTALEKMLYLAYINIAKKWKTAISDWTKIVSQMEIHFEGRLNLNIL
ncbi:IS256 family transposase [Calditrichota bacterium GD2]